MCGASLLLLLLPSRCLPNSLRRRTSLNCSIMCKMGGTMQQRVILCSFATRMNSIGSNLGMKTTVEPIAIEPSSCTVKP